MYNSSDLLNIRKAFRLCLDGMSLDVLESDALEFSEKFGVPIACERDQVADSSSEAAIKDVLVLYNPDQKDDYYKIVVDFELPTKLACLYAYIVGASKNGITKSGATALLQGGKMALANLANGNTETGAPEDCLAEKEYYASLYDIVNALIGAGEV